MTGNGHERLELKLAGIGGQGVLLAAQVLARAGVNQYKYVTWFPSYGTRMRGGDSSATVILSQERIHAPILSRPKAMVMMHTTALERFESTVAPGGLIVVDGSLVEQQVKRDDVESCYVPASQIAVELGAAQLANLVLLGAFLARAKTMPFETVESTLEQMLAEGGKQGLVATNREALRRGFAAAG
jgi:2-oxoglutarate ferredoxin oxidoreductase subunit gamma